MKMRAMKTCLAVILAMATMAGTVSATMARAVTTLPANSIIATASESSVKFTAQDGYTEGAYAEWTAVTNATGYNAYVDGTQIDSMLIRQYPDCFRVDAVGLKAGSHTIKVVPIIDGKEDASKAGETKITSTANDRSGFGFVNGTSSGAYNDDGTLKENATVIYVTEATKDTVTVTLPDKKGKDTELVGVQNIILGLKSNEKVGPVVIRFIGNITDPEVLTKGDLYVDGATCGLTLEGIGKDTTINGFGIVMKGSSNVEVRNVAFMNCNSSEGDNCGLQQDNDHVWVHHCDFYYGDAGSDADQVKGDGALDTKKSTYVTHSYNHFYDNGKCNLQGMKSETTENYVTYHHNWYDHSDSRHPRIRTCTVHIYNNYYDGNAKYGVGVTLGASAFVENNYFRNCKYPMLSSMQGSDIAYGTGTFSGENGGIIKSFGNFMTGQKDYVTYQSNNTEFDAYEASSRDEKVPSSVTAKQGGSSYNNFDTADTMYSYTPDKTEDVPAIVTANAGRVQGGDLQWQFDNSVDDESYAVNQALKDALVAYKDRIVAIGSGFTDSTDPNATEPTQATKPTEETKPTDKTEPTTPTQPTVTPGDVSYTQVIYASPDGTGSGKTVAEPTSVVNAIQNVPAGGIVYLLEGTYNFSETILIDQNNSGEVGKYKTVCAYNNAKVVFDFSAMKTDNANRGIVLDGSYWHFYGFEITKAGDNGMLLSGNNNIIEMMVFSANQDTGLQISRYRTDAATIADWPSNNIIKNCTAKNNCDDETMENADGFAAKLTCGEGNVFDGCISYNNSDDGWDLYAKSETGPIGIVTLKNCIAFRNGFTEDGRGYGDCDGNGFKLGGGGVGSAHVVENCLAFENLNCGFTDNNNPKLGSLKNCTAYNNGIGGNGKANYMVYRCTDTVTKFDNLMTYINTDKVSKTNAKGIKISNDKFVGEMTNSVYYNSKYYFAKSETMTNGAKLGDVITPADSDFMTLSVPEMGTDFHTAWRNADGSPKPAGFAETPSDGTYAALGYHMASGMTQTATPAISFDATTDPIEPKPEETKPEETKPEETKPEETKPEETTPEETTTRNVVWGDANVDGQVDILDIITMNKTILSQRTLESQGFLNADVDQNKKVEPADSLNVMKLVVKLLSESDFPIQ
ncbi:MAG: right-handed parallel beta-helix repeat-containing protein [Oscillospiraceae bacterium]|nr:right-handed parallel beta-helix repeat-containing protein [Oscillospiraceae bacterium]